MVEPDIARRGGAPRSRRDGESASRAGAVFGAAAAALASAGLVYWIGLAKDPTLGAPPVQVALPAAQELPPARADAAEVIRAHEQLQDEYAAGGSAAVARLARTCARDLAAHPGTLDFCLAFNAFATSLAPEAPPLGEQRELLLIQAALPPGGDAWARLGQIRALVRQVGLQGQPGPRREIAAASPPQSAAAKSAAAKSAGVRASAACRRRAPAAPRTVCSSPALRNADLRLRAAYRKAADAGVSSRTLGRDQRRFRIAVQKAAPNRASVARLYARRIRTLESQARQAGG